MDIINETTFGFLGLPGRVGLEGGCSLTLIVKGTFDLVPDQQAVAAEEGIPPQGDEPYEDDDQGTGSARYESDFVYFKPRTDLLLAGKCCCPDGRPAQQCEVTFSVGTHAKTLLVIGDRYWENLLQRGPAGDEARQVKDGVSVAQPFVEMPLRYENSFGGDGYKKNPVGKGYRKQLTEQGEKVLPLPNIEHPGQVITSTRSRPDPAGFGPLGKMWKDRHAKIGTYGVRWQGDGSSWFPKDLDWSHFNSAPPDMQVEGYLRGDEALSMENLHPLHSPYRCQLPGLRLRCFLHKPPPPANPDAPRMEQPSTPDVAAMSKESWQEPVMNLDTLWVDMEAEKLVLVWRGLMPVSDEEYEELRHLLIVTEPLNEQPLSAQHYHQLLAERVAQQNTLEALESGDDPVPEDLQEAEALDVQTEMDKAMAKANASLIGAEVDPNTPLPEITEEEKTDNDQMVKELGINPDDLDGPDGPVLTREIVQERAAMGQAFTDEDLSGLDLSQLDLSGIQFQGGDLSQTNLQNTNLTGADLTGSTLVEADLTGVVLRQAVLNQANLTGANLTKADLSEAGLTQALLDGANLTQAVLNQVSASGVSLAGADLTGVEASQAVLDEADLSNAVLDGAELRQASLKGASFVGASGKKANLSEADLSGVYASEASDFSHSIFRKVVGHDSVWDQADLRHTDFSYAHMHAADFSLASLMGANLSASDMPQTTFAKADLHDALMVRMNLFRGSLEKAKLIRTDMRGSNFYEVEFNGCNISQAKMDGANLKMTRLRYRHTHG